LKFLLALSPTELDLGMPMAWHVMSGGVIQKKKIRVMNRVGDRESSHPIHPVFIFFWRRMGHLAFCGPRNWLCKVTAKYP
jgi:hypothetical protein